MEAYLGMIIMFAGPFEPQGWMFCDGRLLSIQQYSALYSILGNYYGGDGVSNFALPDLRGRVPLAPGKAPDLATTYSLGVKAGFETVGLTDKQLPPHSHTFAPLASTARAAATSPDGAVPATTASASYATTATPDKYMLRGTTSITGEAKPVSLIQPCLPINFLMCVEGLYPPRQ
jgi:microcystin-dependent protein